MTTRVKFSYGVAASEHRAGAAVPHSRSSGRFEANIAALPMKSLIASTGPGFQQPGDAGAYTNCLAAGAGAEIFVENLWRSNIGRAPL